MEMAKGDQGSEVKESGSVNADAAMDCKLKEIYACLCCMLCSKLFEEATTIKLCLHTFCKKCINQAVQETKCCPKCKQDLGSSPEEHLKDDEKIQSIAQKIQPLLARRGILGSEATDVKQGAGTPKPPGTNNQLEEISGEKLHYDAADAEKEKNIDRTTSQESSAFSTTASAVKIPQVAYGVSKTNAEVGESKTEEKITETRKKKRSKNRRARQLTPVETSKIEQKMTDIGSDDIHNYEHGKDKESSSSKKQVLDEIPKELGSDDIHKYEHGKEKESSSSKKQVLDEKPEELCSFWFTLVPQGDKRGRRLPRMKKPYIHLKDSRITVSTIQKYLAQKLNLNDHTEVDVVCCGEKLDESLTLKDIQLIWISKHTKSGRRKGTWGTKELMIELGYARSKKAETPEKK